MSIKTSRASGVAEIEIDAERCTRCGLCVKVCKGGPLYVSADCIAVDQSRGFGCIACGQCVAICPQACIQVDGRDLLPEDVVDLPSREQRAGHDALRALMLARRSVRDYEDRPVDRSVLEQIVEAATMAPMGIPPTDVGVLVLDTKEKVKSFRDDLLVALKGMKSLWMKIMFRMMAGKEGVEMYNSFIVPVIDEYVEKDAEGVDWFFYGAPAAMLFYTSPVGDAADAAIAATYAMLAAESLGLGSCMLGFPAPVLKFKKDLRRKFGLPAKMGPGIALVFGHPAVHYRRAFQRRLANVIWP